MSQQAELARLTVFATDFANLYARYTAHFASLDLVTIESFADVFYASKVEYLHYCGNTTLERPFFPGITDDLLQLSAAYLSLPSAVTARPVRTFGLLLTLLLYSTQPARRRNSEAVSDQGDAEVLGGETQPQSQGEPTAETAGTPQDTASRRKAAAKRKGGGTATSADATSSVTQVAPSSPPHPHLPMRTVPISVSNMRLLLSCMPDVVESASAPNTLDAPHFHSSDSSGTAPRSAPSSALTASASASPLSYTEARALLMLHHAGAWHVEPYVRDGPHVAALLSAHATRGAPLLTQIAAPMPPSAFATTLAARALLHVAASPSDVGGADSLFRDPEFVRLRQEYESARQQLLQ